MACRNSTLRWSRTYFQEFFVLVLVLDSCNFDGGTLCDWTNSPNNPELDGKSYDWQLHKGTTPSKNTGPSGDHSANGQGNGGRLGPQCVLIMIVIIVVVIIFVVILCFKIMVKPVLLQGIGNTL